MGVKPIITESMVERAVIAAGGPEEFIAMLTPEERDSLRFLWRAWARPSQIAPPFFGIMWRVWLVLAGRGYGKTRTGAETVRDRVERGESGWIGLIAPIASDARDVMVEGESGILAISAPDNRPVYEPSKRRLTWRNGARATLYSADEPSRLRGPQHDFIWADEVASWRYAEAWDMAMFGLRLGENPCAIVTTTPRPVRVIKELLARSGKDVFVTRGSTHENRKNLAPAFLSDILRAYEGTRLGRQEIYAELLDDVPGALWNRTGLEKTRIAHGELMVPELDRIVIAIDPAVTSGEDSDETGIIIAGVKTTAKETRAYVLEDISGRMSPDAWARAAVEAYRRWKADRIIAEVNNGGDLVEQTIRTVDPSVPFRAVRASRGKVVRAEPVAALYEQERVHHVGYFGKLEDQMVTFTSDGKFEKSPDRVDALVWALTDLVLDARTARIRTL